MGAATLDLSTLAALQRLGGGPVQPSFGGPFPAAPLLPDAPPPVQAQSPLTSGNAPVPDTSAMQLSAIPSTAPDTAPEVSPLASLKRIDTAPMLSKLGADSDRLNYLQKSGTGISQIGQNVGADGTKTDAGGGFWKKLGRVGATVGDDLLRVAAPNVERLIPGGYGNHQQLLQQQQGVVAGDYGGLQASAQVDDQQAQADQRRALATQEQAKALALTTPKPSAGNLLYDKNGSPIGYQDGDGKYFGPQDPALPQGVRDVLASAQRKQPTTAFELWQSQNPRGTAEQFLQLEAEGKNKPLDQQLIDAETAGDADKANTIRHVIRETRVDPRIIVHNATAPAQPGFGNMGSTSGEDFLKSLPAGAQNVVRATAAGDVQIPPPSARNPQAQALRQAVLQFDPTYTDARYKGKMQFKTSGDAQTLSSLAMAMEHLEALHHSNDAAGFSPMLTHQLTENTTRYMTDAGVFTSELGKLLKGSGVVPEGEANRLMANLTSARHDIRQAAINEYSTLLGGRVQGIMQKYQNATGETFPAGKFLDGQTFGRLQRFGVIPDGAAAPSGQVAAPSQAPGGFTVTAPDGSLHSFPDAASANRFKQATGGR